VQSRGYAGLVILISVLLLLLLCQGLRMGCDLWVTFWGREETANSDAELAKRAAAGQGPPTDHVVWFWIVGCAIFSVVTFVVVGFRAHLFVSLALRVSDRLHRILFRKLLLAPVTLFYDVTPLGRVLNRMSKDFDQVDSFCPDLFAQFLQHSMNLLGGLVLSVVSTPYFLCVIAPVFFVFARLQTYFRLSSRELKRLEGVTRSPIFSMFSESLLGLATIRASSYRARRDSSPASRGTRTRRRFSHRPARSERPLCGICDRSAASSPSATARASTSAHPASRGTPRPACSWPCATATILLRKCGIFAC
jgi:ABC-type multidrug transport system fused ATPase/permease subunit